MLLYYFYRGVSSPGRPIHSDTNSTYLGRIQPCSNYSANTNQSHFQCSLLPGTHLYSFILHHGDDENAQASKRQQRGFEPGLL